MPAMPKASELSLGVSVFSKTITVVCADVFCPCDDTRIMSTEPGTYLNLRQLDRAINAHITTARTNAERAIYA